MTPSCRLVCNWVIPNVFLRFLQIRTDMRTVSDIKIPTISTAVAVPMSSGCEDPPCVSTKSSVITSSVFVEYASESKLAHFH